MNSLIQRTFCRLLIVSVVCLGLPIMPAHAAMVSTAQTVHASHATAERARLDTILARADVRQQLLAFGVSPAEVKQRVASLTDDEVAGLNARFDQLHPGGGVVGAVIGAAVLIFVILLITDILGLTDVFGFVKHR